MCRQTAISRRADSSVFFPLASVCMEKGLDYPVSVSVHAADLRNELCECVSNVASELCECVSEVVGCLSVESIVCDKLNSKFADFYSSYHVAVKVNANDFSTAIDMLNAPDSYIVFHVFVICVCIFCILLHIVRKLSRLYDYYLLSLYINHFTHCVGYRYCNTLCHLSNIVCAPQTTHVCHLSLIHI